jgi:hypothetical protein
MARKNSKIRRTPPFIRLLSSNHQYQITFTLISAILFTGLDAGLSLMTEAILLRHRCQSNNLLKIPEP